MKLITLNSHSLIEENYEEKFHRFIQGILTERPDILALQEVNQNMAETEADPPAMTVLTRGWPLSPPSLFILRNPST